MAAGLELDEASLPAFRAAFAQHAASQLTPDDLIPREKVDAVASGGTAGLSLAEELDRLGPFGPGNPAPTLLLPAARLESVRSMGDQGQHSRLTVRSGGARMEAVAFRASAGSLNKLAQDQHDLAVRLERNEWNGSVSPRLVLRAVCPARPGELHVIGEDGDFFDRLAAELDQHPLGPWTIRATGSTETRTTVDRRGDGAAAVTADLLTTGEPVLLVCADVPRRGEALHNLLGGIGDLAVAGWDTFAARPSIAAGYAHVIAMDPPPTAAGEALLATAPGQGFAHLAWGPAESEFTLAVGRASYELRPAVTAFYKALREAGTLSGKDLKTALCGDGRHPRSAAVAARVVRVLSELKFAEFGRTEDGPVATFLTDAKPRPLEKSRTYTACRNALEDVEGYHSRRSRAARAA
jgi:single-stranded-DNA-specific exonuclease